MKLNYPFEIESNGTRWVYESNKKGQAIYPSGDSEPAGNRCEEMIEDILNQEYLWPAGSCEYMGPLRKTQESK